MTWSAPPRAQTSSALVLVRVSAPAVPMMVRPWALVTVAVVVAVLSPGTGSGWSACAAAAVVTAPVACASTPIWTVAVAPGGSAAQAAP
ncbi:hypothetical protein OHA72_36100 [Dactylosporangium sp. NBC_01737]|uniref:hypothetical protein n=1 Tax=Dactylosporangium sp. NBC_01737 TaxID=2975959 RepID=UPI002E102962|nr:hypothetical protein OHA72_36100 [Dactylosporangium sp. NBC_01737]